MYSRVLKQTDLILFACSQLFGAGIFVLLGNASKHSKQYTWISIIISGCIALFSVYSYSQISKKIQSSGGEYTFIEKIFNKPLATISGTIMIISGILCASAVSLGFGNYVQVFLNKAIGLQLPVLIYAILGIGVTGIINSRGIQQSIQFSKLNVILIIIGFIAMGIQGIKNKPFAAIDESVPLPKILYSAFLMSFAYWGFGSITKLADETIQPEKVISNAMYIAVGISIVCYACIAYIAVKIVGYDALTKSKSPLSLVSSALFGEYGFYFMSILGIIAMISTIFILNMSRSRMIHYIADQYNIPYLSKLSEYNKTPLFAIIFTTLLTILFACINNIEKLATYANQLWLGVLVLINIAATKIGVTNTEKIIPILGAIQTVIITVMSIFN
jgi:basic amino acid/polyamine antiporter, APA family